MEDSRILEESIRDYSLRVEKVCRTEHHCDREQAMQHPNFEEQHKELLWRLSREYRLLQPLGQRPAGASVICQPQPAEEAVRWLSACRGFFTEWALEVISSSEPTSIDSNRRYLLVEATVEEVTGKDKSTVAEVYTQRDRLGYCDMPLHLLFFFLAPSLFSDSQSFHEWRTILVKPTSSLRGQLSVICFNQQRDGKWIDGDCAEPGDFWYGDKKILLCRRDLDIPEVTDLLQ